MQEVEKIVNGKDLFKRPEYKDVLAKKTIRVVYARDQPCKSG